MVAINNPQLKQRITAAEYFATTPETNLPMELIDGEIIAMPAPNDDHQHIVSYLHALLFAEIVLKNLGQLRHAPTDIQIDDRNVVQPDIFFIANGNMRCTRVENKHWQGAPDLCVEVLSSSTAKRDLDHKFNLYAKYGVQEYWIVSPEHRYIEIYTLTEGQYVRAAIYGAEDTLQSPLLPSLSFAVKTIFY